MARTYHRPQPTQPAKTGGKPQSSLSQAAAFSAALLFAVAGCQWKLAGPLGLSELLLPVAAVLCALWWLREHKGPAILAVPGWCYGLVLLAAAALFVSPAIKGPKYKEVAQLVQFLLFIPAVATAGFMILGHRFQLFYRPLGIVVLANAGYALVQAHAMAAGTPVTGFFQSQMALSVFLGLATVWMLPFALHDFRGVWRGLLLAGLLGLVLAAIPNGLVLIATLVCFLVAGLASHDGRDRAKAVGALLVALAIVAMPFHASHRQEMLNDIYPFKNNEVKKMHLERLAAFRMAAAHPLAGVGPFHYQTQVSRYYGDGSFRKPNTSTTKETQDTTSGLGVLAGSYGFLVFGAFALLLLTGVAQSLRTYARRREAYADLALAGLTTAPLLLFCLVVSDPLIRGTGCLVGLIIASLHFPFLAPGQLKAESPARAPLVRLAAVAVLLGVAVIVGVGGRQPATVPAGGTPPVCGSCETDARPAPSPEVTQTAPATGVRILLQAGKDAQVVYGPAKLVPATGETGGSQVWEVAEEAGKPPEGSEGAPYGGARFEIEMPKAGKVKVWVRAWWEGGCSNSVFVKGEGQGPAIVLTDNTYKTWHWVEPGEIVLPAGKQTLLLLNREDGVKIDQLLITGDDAVPQGIEE